VEGSWEDHNNIGGSEDRRMRQITFWLICEPNLGGESDAAPTSVTTILDRTWLNVNILRANLQLFRL